MPDFNHNRSDPFGLIFDPSETETKFVVPADGGQFDGHFDGHPIAPGALLLDWMFRQASRSGIDDPTTALSRSRFMREVCPGDPITIRSRPDRRGIVVEVLVGDEVAARAWFQKPA